MCVSLQTKSLCLLWLRKRPLRLGSLFPKSCGNRSFIIFSLPDASRCCSVNTEWFGDYLSPSQILKKSNLNFFLKFAGSTSFIMLLLLLCSTAESGKWQKLQQKVSFLWKLPNPIEECGIMFREESIFYSEFITK